MLSAAACDTLSIRAGGGVTPYPSITPPSSASLTAGSVYFYGAEDTGTVRTDGIAVSVPIGIHCTASESGGVPHISPLVMKGDDVIIDDPGYISVGSTLQDIKSEGCARAYSRKVSNNVRYATVTVRIRATRLDYVARLLRMAESPYPVLLVTDTYMMKGYVETVATDASSVGKEFIVYKVTIAEAL